jgi:hypothetical protein
MTAQLPSDVVLEVLIKVKWAKLIVNNQHQSYVDTLLFLSVISYFQTLKRHYSIVCEKSINFAQNIL